MELLIALISIFGGFGILAYGANFLVDGATGIARKFGLSEMLIGLTVVAIGTSAPELIVSVVATIQGNTDISIGNAVGSNIANILLVLGLTAIIMPMTLARSTLLIDIPLTILVTLLLLLLVSDIWIDGAESNILSRIDGIILLLFAVIFFIYNIRGKVIETTDIIEEEVTHSTKKLLLFIGGGIFALFFGGKILVDGSVHIAKIFGLSEAIIGLTIIAIGTSTPELVTSIVATFKKKTNITIGNIIGSNILNILIILGISACIRPLPFSNILQMDLIVSLMAPILLLSLSQIWIRHRIGRAEGIILFICYMWYISFLIIREL